MSMQKYTKMFANACLTIFKIQLLLPSHVQKRLFVYIWAPIDENGAGFYWINK